MEKVKQDNLEEIKETSTEVEFPKQDTFNEEDMSIIYDDEDNEVLEDENN